MRDVTLVFPIKKKEGVITEVCLAMKKRGFGTGRWNGMGGKLLEEEGLLEAAQREVKEEVGIETKHFDKVAELTFTFAQKPEWNQKAHVYTIDSWQGDPIESEEMKPEWFSLEDVPYDAMWPDDIYWLPLVFQGKKLKAEFLFGEHDSVLEKEINEVFNFA